MPAHSSVKASDSQGTLWSSTVLGGFSALRLQIERDAIMYFLLTTPNIHTPGHQLQHSTTTT